MGKTALALNIATSVAREKKSVAFFLLEMSKAQLKLLAKEFDVPVLNHEMFSMRKRIFSPLVYTKTRTDSAGQVLRRTQSFC